MLAASAPPSATSRTEAGWDPDWIVRPKYDPAVSRELSLPKSPP